MSFGLRNAPSTFQRCIHQTLPTFPYLDDILIASESEEEHQNHLKIAFERFSKYGLRINMEKSVFGVKEIEFLGYLITPEGFSPLPERVKFIQEYKLPTTIQELRAFLGMLNFYRPFLKDAAETQSILHDYLKGSKKKDKRLINWTEEAKEIFNKCKNDLAKATLLSCPNSELPLSLCTDASNWAIGAVLQQYEKEAWKPIALFSKKLNESQKNYSTYDRELLSIYMSIKHFKYMLEGRTFKIFTDHKPLVFAFKQRNDKASPRQVRQLQYISQFSTDIIYIKGEQNIVADNLSRIEDITKIIDYDEIAKEQDKDKELIELINSNKSLKFKRYPLPSGKSLWCDTSTENIRPFVPKQFRMKNFQQIHGLSHPGIKTSVKDMTSRFIWPDIKRNIKEWAQTCIQCQRNKTSRHTKSEIKQFKEPDERFSTVHIDLIGPFPPSNEYVYCLTCIDRFTGWIEAIPIRNETAETVARAFYEGWITRFGVPYEVITDQGRQFTSKLFKTLATLCGVKLKHTTAYHPQSNGKIERFHRTLKAAIRAHNSNKWTESIPTVLLGLRAALRKDSDYSLTQMVYGKTIKLPGELFDAPKISTTPEIFLHKLQKQMESLKPKLTRHNTSPKIFVFKDFETCSHVFLKTCRVRKSLEPAYEGPFKVTSRTDKYFSIEIKGKEINVSIDRLKPAYILKEEEDIATRPGVAGDPRLAPPGEDKEPSASAAPKMSRSGRTIRNPVRFRDKVECYPAVVSNLNLRKMETENKPSDTSEICKVSVKIPPFWVENPEIWFFQVEAQFKIGGIIQEDTKFNYLISQLEPKYIENIWDIINSKSDNKYSECKSRLLELFRESEGLRIKKLISGIELGDLKPSQLLQKLRSLATPDISDNLIKNVWLDKLPTSIENILIVSDEDISKLAIMADKINEINSSKEIYDAEVPSSSTDRLIAKLEDLERQVSELRLDRSRSRSKNRTQLRPRMDRNAANSSPRLACCAINKDNNHSLSQMVYGKTIRLPGEFFDDSKHHLHAEEFVQQLQKQMELLKPLNEKHHSKTKVFVHKDLKTCSHVFIRTDRVRKPLEPPYEGPFPVLDRTDKYFTLKVKGRNVTTSIDRLRPAYLLADSDNITSEHPTAARSIVSGPLPSTSSQQNPDPPDVEKYTEFQGTGSPPDLTRTRSGRIIKKP
ncbi:hypothetical protein LAZ67_15001806, partial [Cordylochernes scorpioides]